jgi:hypothetical protein
LRKDYWYCNAIAKSDKTSYHYGDQLFSYGSLALCRR